MQFISPSIEFYALLLFFGIAIFFISRLMLMRKIKSRATLNLACALIAVFVMAAGYFGMLLYIFNRFSGTHGE